MGAEYWLSAADFLPSQCYQDGNSGSQVPCFCHKSVYTSFINLPAAKLEHSAEKDGSNSARGCNEDKLLNLM